MACRDGSAQIVAASLSNIAQHRSQTAARPRVNYLCVCVGDLVIAPVFENRLAEDLSELTYDIQIDACKSSAFHKFCSKSLGEAKVNTHGPKFREILNFWEIVKSQNLVQKLDFWRYFH